MFKLIENVVSADALAELHAIADRGTFVDGRVSNPHSKVKNNLQLHDPAVARRVTEILAQALYGNDEFTNYAFPRVIAPPMITTYRPGMHYGLHTDVAFMQIGERALRADLSCTIFLSDPASYDGGALRIALGTSEVLIRPAAGAAILYPSTTLHEVTPVTRGERRVGLTFIESSIADSQRREMLYELNEVAALEGLTMHPDNYTRLQRVQANLLRQWAGAE